MFREAPLPEVSRLLKCVSRKTCYCLEKDDSLMGRLYWLLPKLEMSRSFHSLKIMSRIGEPD